VASKLPLFTNALTYINAGFLTKAHASNASYTQAAYYDDAIAQSMRSLINDPQTSGGLLLSVSPQRADDIVQTLRRGYPAACVIGEVTERGSHIISYKNC
jgi:selenide,water dikinase